MTFNFRKYSCTNSSFIKIIGINNYKMFGTKEKKILRNNNNRYIYKMRKN